MRRLVCLTLSSFHQSILLTIRYNDMTPLYSINFTHTLNIIYLNKTLLYSMNFTHTLNIIYLKIKLVNVDETLY